MQAATTAFKAPSKAPATAPQEPMVAIPLHLLEQLLHSQQIVKRLMERSEETSAAPEDDEPHIGFGRDLVEKEEEPLPPGKRRIGFDFH